MMDAMELAKRLAQSEFVQSELSLNVQLGLPWLEKRGESLCICFEPHVEELLDDRVLYYAPQYELAWMWPFEHLASFRRLTLDVSTDYTQPCCSMGVEQLLSAGKYIISSLYQECTRVLCVREKEGSVTDAWVEKYQRDYRGAVERLGLQSVYGARWQ